MTVSTLERSISVTTAPGTWLSGATLIGFLAGSERADLVIELEMPSLASSPSARKPRSAVSNSW
jgi:hypothetical protein